MSEKKKDPFKDRPNQEPREPDVHDEPEWVGGLPYQPDGRDEHDPTL